MSALQTLTRIVIVDDDANLTSVVAMMAHEALGAGKVRIQTVTSVDAAQAAIVELAADPGGVFVFVSDYHLPPSSRTGLDLLAEVRARLPRAKRVLMTGRDPRDLEPHVTHARLDGFLAKPFTFPQFAPLLDRLVREARGEARP